MTDTAAADQASVELIVNTLHRFFPSFDYRYNCGWFNAYHCLSYSLGYVRIHTTSSCWPNIVYCYIHS